MAERYWKINTDEDYEYIKADEVMVSNEGHLLFQVNAEGSGHAVWKLSTVAIFSSSHWLSCTEITAVEYDNRE